MPIKMPIASDIAYTKKIYEMHMNSPLQSALDMMVSKRNIYRLTVVDSKRRVRGIISGIRVLDIMTGRRGIGIKKRAGKGIEALLRQPVRLFITEYLHKLSYEIPLRGLISYIVENDVGHLVLVDQMDTLQGVITERCIITHLPVKSLGIKISDLMTTDALTVSTSNTLLEAALIMASRNIRRLPVLEDENICGMITVSDILNYLISSEHHIEAILSKEDMKKYMEEPIKSLNLVKPVVLESKNELSALLELIKKPLPSGFPVIDANGKMIGIISPRDVVVKLPKLIGLQMFIELMQLKN